MSNQDNAGLLDIIQERLSNPALLTFAWVYVIYNWQAFGWFLFEPIKFSRRITEFSNTSIEVYFLAPLGWTLLVIVLGRGLNNLVELCQRFWDQLFNYFLKKVKWKEFVDNEKYNTVLDKMFSLQNEVRQLNSEKNSFEDTIKELRSNNYILENEKGTLETEKSTLENEKSTLENEKSTLENEKSALENEKSALENEKSALENEKSALESKNSNLEYEKAILKKEKATLESQNLTLENQISTLNNKELSKYKNTINQLENEITSLKNNLNTKQGANKANYRKSTHAHENQSISLESYEPHLKSKGTNYNNYTHQNYSHDYHENRGNSSGNYLKKDNE
mgnify:CR=1 FL=1